MKGLIISKQNFKFSTSYISKFIVIEKRDLFLSNLVDYLENRIKIFRKYQKRATCGHHTGYHRLMSFKMTWDCSCISRRDPVWMGPILRL